MKKELGLLTFALGTLLSMTGFAQDSETDNHVITIKVPNVALIDLETTVSKSFDAEFIQEDNEAGEKIKDADDNSDTWLNYSSILTGETLRSVFVKASVLVAGIDISVNAAAAATGAKGTLGTTAGKKTLTLADQEMITGIGSAYTGTGNDKGHKLTYTFEALDDSYGSLRADNTDVTVTYTLGDSL